MDMDGLPTPRRYWAMLTIAMVITLAVIDGAIANVALPTIARDLHASPADSIWVVNAYQTAVVAALLPLASLGEIYGYRRIYQGGVALFIFASLWCALSRDMNSLVLARILQGIGGAGIMSMNSTMVRFTFPHRMLGTALGLNAVVVALGSVLGPTIASAILSVATWPWLFAINVPLAAASFAIGLFTLPSPAGSHRRFDWPSALLNVLTFGPFILGLQGLISGGALVASSLELAIGMISGVLLVLRSLKEHKPFLPIDLMRIPLFRMSIATSLAAFTAQSFVFVALPFLIEYAFGRSAVQTGLLMTPWSMAVAVIAPISGRLTDRYRTDILGSAGLLTLGVGVALLALLPAHPSSFDIGWRMAVAGLGFGFFQQPNNRALLTAGPRERAGSAGGMLATARLLGQTAGATLVALLFRFVGPAAAGPKIMAVAAAFALIAATVNWMKPDRGRLPGHAAPEG